MPNPASDQPHHIVYIIILNWNGAKDTVECLESLQRITYKNCHIVLVDNGSTDDSKAVLKDWIRKHSPAERITLLELNENLGFSGGNNVGIDHAIKQNAEYVLLLNNDTIVTENFLTQLIATANQEKSAGVISCKIKCYSAKEKIWSCGGHVNFVKGAFYPDTTDVNGILETDYITGCLMLIPTQIIRTAGMLSEKYFLTWEDMDLCYRVKKAGYRLILNCDAVIYHKFNASIGGLYRFRSQYYFHRNRMIFFSENLVGIKKHLFIYFQFLCAIPAWLIIELLRGHGEAIQGAFCGYKDFLKGVSGKSSYC
ncbi:MAG: hypothetical protein A2787_00215 [Omnitrophica WOR_2 bacterium RIFCSPHIGHO2_01_FULL_48_9]|nr:MAG: hypothetical protein A2787_00215 [Omnitrophica WOR_2 bacterium RIFCSPHIGHO2_01_FULL_48_9]